MGEESQRRQSTKGEDVLNLLDEAAKRPRTAAKCRKRSVSTKRNQVQ